MDIYAEFARQGLGYLLATIEAGAIIWLFKRLDQKDKEITDMITRHEVLQEKRVSEAKEYPEKFITLGKDLINGMGGIKDAQQAFTRFIEKFPIKNV